MKGEIFKNLKYGTNFEVDGLVIFDDNIFIVESKSNKFTIGAKKGNIEKITSTVSVSTPHELSVNDIVSLDIAPSTSIGSM